MRKLIYLIATSIDGFIAHPDGSINGFLTEGAHADDYVAAIQSYDTILMGRATYTFGYAYGLEPGQRPYHWAENWVFSKSLDFNPAPGLHLSAGDPVETVRKLKQKPGTDIYLCGGGGLAGTLLAGGEIDRLVLKINPIVLGDGIPLFGGQPSLTRFMPTDHKIYDNGVMTVTYDKH